jgi:hypothetical protein
LVAGWLLVFAAAAAFAQEPLEAARRHFRSGVALFQNGDFTAALAEFEASQRDQPSASTMQNIALCLTRLHRYLQALETLDKLKAEHGASLSTEDRVAVEASIKELSQLVGTVTLRVTPAGAQVSINGKPLPAGAASKPIRLSSGEYTFRAEAPSYAVVERTQTIAGGEDRVVELVLRALGGEVDIVASDRDAAIAVDSEAVGQGAWKGTMAPGEHLVQVYKQGYRSYSTRIPVKAGDHIELRPLLGPPELSPRVPAGPATDTPRGWYGLFTATTLVPVVHPDGYATDGAWNGAAFGLRGGYRLWQYVAFELMLDAGKQSVGPGDYTGPGAATSRRASYDLTTARLGGNVRLLWGGRIARLSAAIGVGAVSHNLAMEERKAKGDDSYFLMELGVQFNIGKVLLEGVLMSMIEGAANVKDDAGTKMYTGHTFIPQVGGGFRVGMGQWGKW